MHLPAPSPAEIPPEPAWSEAMVQDVRTLHDASRHIRWIAWFHVFLCAVALVVCLVRWLRHQDAAALLLVSLILFGLASMYFALARSVGRGRSWAILASFALICTSIALAVMRILDNKQAELGYVIVETIYLLALLNLAKLLLQGWAASQRLRLAFALIQADRAGTPYADPRDRLF